MWHLEVFDRNFTKEVVELFVTETNTYATNLFTESPEALETSYSSAGYW